MISRFLFGWLLGAGLVYLVAGGLDESLNYSLLSGWWCSVALLRGVKATRAEWLQAAAVALLASMCNLVFNLEVRQLNGSSLFLLFAAAFLVVSPLFAAFLLDSLLRVFSSLRVRKSSVE